MFAVLGTSFINRFNKCGAIVLACFALSAHAQNANQVKFSITANGVVTDVIVQKVPNPAAAFAFINADIDGNTSADQSVVIDYIPKNDSEAASELRHRPNVAVVPCDAEAMLRAMTLERDYPGIVEKTNAGFAQESLRNEAQRERFYRFGWGVTVVKAFVSGTATYMAFNSWFDGQIIPNFMLAAATAGIGMWYQTNCPEIFNDISLLSDRVMGKVGFLKKFSGPLTGSESRINLAVRHFGIMAAAYTFISTVYYSTWSLVYVGLSAEAVPGKLLAKIHEHGVSWHIAALPVVLQGIAYIADRINVSSAEETTADIVPSLTAKAILNRMDITETQRRMSLSVVSAAIGVFSSFMVMAANFAQIHSLQVAVWWGTGLNVVGFLFSDFFSEQSRAEIGAKARARLSEWSERFPEFSDYIKQSVDKWNVAYEHSHVNTAVQFARSLTAPIAPVTEVAESNAPVVPAIPHRTCRVALLDPTIAPSPPQYHLVRGYRAVRAWVRGSRGSN